MSQFVTQWGGLGSQRRGVVMVTRDRSGSKTPPATRADKRHAARKAKRQQRKGGK
jgi:hypothetical protein